MSDRVHLIYNPERECMSRDKLHAWQSARLRETVRREYDNVPMYRARMDEKGVKPEDIRSVDDLKYLPFMEKTDLRDYYPFDLLASPQSEIVRIQGSSGTTGKPIVAGYTRNDIDVWSEMMARTLTAAGCTRDDKVQVAYGLGLFTGGFGAYQGADRIGAMVVPMSSGNTQRQIMMMKDLGATILCCTPSYATYLGETIRGMGIDPNKDLKLKPGLTANVTIYTLEKNDVLAAPAKALRFVPNEALLKNGQQIEDVEAKTKVWTLEGNTFKAHAVEVGTSNGMLTEITSGISAGTEVLVDFKITGGEMEAPGQQAQNPFMPRPRNNRQQGGNAGGQQPRR